MIEIKLLDSMVFKDKGITSISFISNSKISISHIKSSSITIFNISGINNYKKNIVSGMNNYKQSFVETRNNSTITRLSAGALLPIQNINSNINTNLYSTNLYSTNLYSTKNGNANLNSNDNYILDDSMGSSNSQGLEISNLEEDTSNESDRCMVR